MACWISAQAFPLREFMQYHGNGDGGRRTTGFYDFYRIDEDNEADEEEQSEPRGSKELKATGLNSLWGIVYLVAEKTGWSYNEIVYKRSWINIRMMLADAPGTKYAKKGKSGRKLVMMSGDDLVKKLKLEK